MFFVRLPKGCKRLARLQLRKQYDKLVDALSKELIHDVTFKEKSDDLLAQIKEAEDDVANTTNSAASLRAAMHKTIDVIAHGRERFENGGITGKRDVLLALGSTPTLYDGIIELTPYDWLIPIEEGLPELKSAIKKVQPQDLQIGNPELEPIRTKWLHKAESAQTPREDIILQLTSRYYSLATALQTFKDFDFVPRTPVKQLVL